MRDQKKKSTKKKNKQKRDNTCPLSPHPQTEINQPPHLSHPPITHNNNAKDTEFLVQMRQSNKCGSARNDEILLSTKSKYIFDFDLTNSSMATLAVSSFIFLMANLLE